MPQTLSNFSTSKIKSLTTQNVNQEISDILPSAGRKFLCQLKLDKLRFIDAVIETVDSIRSPLLTKFISILAKKLLSAIGGMRALIGNVAYTILTFSVNQAQKIRQIATAWGNRQAEKWASDEGFIQYLSVVELNNLPMYRTST